jgi:hypothetical protein
MMTTIENVRGRAEFPSTSTRKAVELRDGAIAGSPRGSAPMA